MKIDGRCHCGAISYEADINPDNVLLCHCTDCQTISGGPCRMNVPVRREKFQLRGDPKLYTKTADSGAEVTTAFCSTCGAALFSQSPRHPDVFNLRLGTATQRSQLPPKRQGFCDSALPWVWTVADVPKIARPAGKAE